MTSRDLPAFDIDFLLTTDRAGLDRAMASLRRRDGAPTVMQQVAAIEARLHDSTVNPPHQVARADQAADELAGFDLQPDPTSFETPRSYEPVSDDEDMEMVQETNDDDDAPANPPPGIVSPIYIPNPPNVDELVAQMSGVSVTRPPRVLTNPWPMHIPYNRPVTIFNAAAMSVETLTDISIAIIDHDMSTADVNRRLSSYNIHFHPGTAERMMVDIAERIGNLITILVNTQGDPSDELRAYWARETNDAALPSDWEEFLRQFVPEARARGQDWVRTGLTRLERAARDVNRVPKRRRSPSPESDDSMGSDNEL